MWKLWSNMQLWFNYQHAAAILHISVHAHVITSRQRCQYHDTTSGIALTGSHANTNLNPTAQYNHSNVPIPFSHSAMQELPDHSKVARMYQWPGLSPAAYQAQTKLKSVNHLPSLLPQTQSPQIQASTKYSAYHALAKT